MTAEARTRAERRRDAERRLAEDVDLWVASASADCAPYLVPLSFDCIALPDEQAERFAARAGFDPRASATPFRVAS